MPDATRKYTIEYIADGAEETARRTLAVAAAVGTVDQKAGDATNQLAALNREAAQTAAVLGTAGKALSGLKSADLGGLKSAAVQLGQIGDNLTFARQETANLKAGLNDLGTATRPAGAVAASVGRIGDNAMKAARNVTDAGVAVGTLGAQRGAVDGVVSGIEKLQRKGYGAKKNVEELNAELAKVGSNAAGLGQAADSAGRLAGDAGKARVALRGSAAATRGIARGLMAVAGGISAVELARKVAGAVGDSVNDARALTVKGAERAIAMRDQLREVANLQGKAAPDDETVATALRLRMASGMGDSDADKFLRRWYGSLEAGRGKGNIDDETARKVQGIAGTLAIRTGMDAGTGGDLAASLANYGKVASSAAASGQLGTIVDRLNEGRGDLTPLANSLLKVAGTLVGPKGSAFSDLGELASVLGVASNSASPTAAGTMITQTMRGLSFSGKKSDALLNAAGVTGGDDFLERVRKIKPYLDRAESQGLNPTDYLRDQGFGNSTDRRGIVYFARNFDLLQKRMDQTRAARGADNYASAGARVAELNDRFLSSDPARDRIAVAAGDAAEYGRYAAGARQQTERRLAEARLKAAGAIDGPWSNFVAKAADGFGLYPMLGAQPTREEWIDREAARPQYGDPLARGGAAAGDAGKVNQLLQTLVDEARKTNTAIEAGKAPPPFKARVDPIR